MKKKIYNLFILTLLIMILITILLYSSDVINSVISSFEIWKNNVFPTLFPFFIISDLLINYGLIDILGELTKKAMNKIFYLPGEASFVIISSMFSGFPSSAKFIKNLLDEKKITISEAEYLLTFTHFSSPLFVIGFIGIAMLNDKKLGFIILISHILSNFIIAFIIRKKKNVTSSKIDFNKALSPNKKSFIVVLTSSITKTINTLLMLLGIITTFLIVSTIISKTFNLPPFIRAVLSGILEMTQGIKYISLINIPTYVKASIMGGFISFGGISIHLQVMSILSDAKIKYSTYLSARITHAILTSGIILVLTQLL